MKVFIEVEVTSEQLLNQSIVRSILTERLDMEDKFWDSNLGRFVAFKSEVRDMKSSD